MIGKSWMRSGWLICGLLLLVASPVAARKESVQELITKAESAPEKDRPSLYIKAAEQRLEDADRLYHTQHPQDAQAAVQDISNYCTRAYDAADHSGDKLKKTEISIRKIADKLTDVRRDLDFEDQAPVQATVNHLEDLRTKLLDRMFGKGKK